MGWRLLTLATTFVLCSSFVRLSFGQPTECDLQLNFLSEYCPIFAWQSCTSETTIIKPTAKIPNNETILMGCTEGTLIYKNKEYQTVKSMKMTCLNGMFIDESNHLVKIHKYTCDGVNTPKFKTKLTKFQGTVGTFYDAFYEIDGLQIYLMSGLLDASGNALYNQMYYEYQPKEKSKGVRPDFSNPKAFNIQSDENTIDSYENLYPNVKSECYGDVNFPPKRLKPVNYFGAQCYATIKDKKAAILLSRGHLAPNSYFTYGFMQYSTFYYSNAAPQWQITNGGNFFNVENCLQKLYDTEMRQKQIIYTGTHGTLKVTDDDGSYTDEVAKLDANCPLRIPELYWKTFASSANPQEHIVIVVFNSPCPREDLVNKLNQAGCTKENCNRVGGGKGSCNFGKEPVEKGLTLCCNSVSDARQAFEEPGEINELNLPGLGQLL